MASCQTTRWVSSAPYAKLTVTQTGSTDTAVTLSWTLQYISDYEAHTNGVGRAYTVKIGGTTVKTGTYNINNVTGTKTVASGTHTINKTTSAQTVAFSVSFEFSLTWNGVYGGTKSASSSISVAAKTSYKVSYNANGGSGAPSAQTKWHGTALTLSSTKPTRTGYAFQGWATSSSGSVAYAAGASYTANATVTLYAVWKANTYSVKYNANGGSGAPAAQTKTYGVTLKLSTTVPTRTNYTFLGWSTSASATSATYAAGANYTANAAVTLYAVWKLAYTPPKISNVYVARCTSDGVPSDTGTHLAVEFDWSTFYAVSSITITWESPKSSLKSTTVSQSGTSGSVGGVIGDGVIANDQTYTVVITVKDSGGSTPITRTVAGAKFAIDFLKGGKGAAMNKPAELEGVFDIAFQTRHYGGLLPMVLPPETDLNDILTPNTYVGENTSNYNYVNCPLEEGTFTLEVTSGGEDGQIRQVLTRCHKKVPITYERWYYASSWGEWLTTRYGDSKILWGADKSSGMYMTAGHTATLTENVLDQDHGIVLVFSYYNSASDTNYGWQSFFIPKAMVTLSGSGHTFMLTNRQFGYVGTKYLYINNASIGGHADNSLTGTASSSGITYTNNKFVLRYVFGV